MSSAAAQSVVIVAGAASECCGTDSCLKHTLLQHDNHLGHLVDGKVRPGAG
jgi:hypothetical protein